MEIRKKLLMSFKTADDKRVSITVDNPREDVTEAEIVATMNLIVTNDVFAPNDTALVSTVGAKVIETGTTEFDLVL